MDFSQVKSVTIPEGEATKIEVGGTTIWEKEDWGTITTTIGGTSYELKSSADFDALCGTGDIVLGDGTTISRGTVSTFSFGNNYSKNIGDNFLAGCNQLTVLTNFPNNIRTIGNYFLSGCVLLGSGVPVSLTIPRSVTSIGEGFMYNCDKYVGPLTVNVLPTKEPRDIYSLSTTNPSADMYTTGVTVQGTDASVWKAALPNRSVSPYRKLI